MATLHSLSLVLLSLAPASSLVASFSTHQPSTATSCRRSSAVRCMPRPLPAERVMFIDGNNLMAHRKVTKGREALAAKLAGIKPVKVTLVFDGKHGESPSDSGSNPRIVITQGSTDDGSLERETADEWIERELSCASRDCQVEVVTADRNLRRVAHLSKVKTINPAKFWRRYLARLKGLKNDYLNIPNEEKPGATVDA